MSETTKNTRSNDQFATNEVFDNFSLGAFLAAERKRKNISDSAIANQMRIDLKYIKAIEAGCYEELPGITFTQGYIRTYARILGIDSHEIEEQLRVITKQELEPHFIIRGMPKKQKTVSLSSLFTVIFSLIIIAIVGLTGTWLYHNHIEKNKHSVANNVTMPIDNSSKHSQAQVTPFPSGSKSLAHPIKHQAYPASPTMMKHNS